MAYKPNSWMADLAAEATKIPLNLLAIPGSHDSGAAHLDKSIGISNAEVDLKWYLSWLYYVPYIDRTVTEHTYKWSKTQNLSLKEQLEAGIRYLDLRVTLRTGTQELRFHHGLYAIEVADGLKAIHEFMIGNPFEVVILHFQAFYNMNPEVHKTLLKMIADIFGEEKLVPNSKADNVQSLDQLWEKKGRVIVIYNDSASQSASNIWPGSAINSQWANKTSAKELTSFLDDKYRSWNKTADTPFFVSQWVLTPPASFKYYVRNRKSNLENLLSVQASKAFVDWLKDPVTKPGNINICLVDFVENYEFIPTVIDLNKRRR